MFDIKMEGLEGLRSRMQKTTSAVQNRLARNALSAGARTIVKQARENVQQIDDPETGRAISKNIVSRYRSKRSRQTGDVVVSVGVQYPRGKIPKGNPDDGINTPHWHLLELGTEKMRARPFLVPAALQAGPKVPQAFIDKFSKDLEKL